MATKMITVAVRAPLPRLLCGITGTDGDLLIELPYEQACCLHDVFNSLGDRYPVFQAIWDNANSELIGTLLIVIDGKIVTSPKEWDNPLTENSEVIFLTPYAGG